MSEPEGNNDRLTAHLLADLQAACASMERARLMLTDALTAPSAHETRKKARDARNTLGSALQTLALAVDLAKALRKRLSD